MKELFTLYYHRRILFTDFFSQSPRMLHQVEETVNSNLNFDMLIRTTFMISLENFKDVFIHFIRTS